MIISTTKNYIFIFLDTLKNISVPKKKLSLLPEF